MVRSVVGALVADRPLAALLAQHDRAGVGDVAPPHGLCLEDVGY
jgi:hypothetical protein